ncbi:RNA deprotection pyrophosphohydrolase [Neobacillus sp. LXY-1]|uniref:RNA deprotection pyrophosphohydrolase n=1 Tax=Neobacillus sp. LXY-1 TaxID=3379133 RepID=UPI003EE26182
MKQFFDDRGNLVELSFDAHSFPEEPKHVLVISQWDEDWVLTNHKERGLEFPGGKREQGESLEEAARREAFEETGAVFDTLTYIADYRVMDENGSFVKAVFWGKVTELKKTDGYYETNGPVIIKGDLLQLRFGAEYSFIMKDQVVEECIKYIQLLINC